jgi:NTP pyrophosphatase (non-canonical NTP hydrolase)
LLQIMSRLRDREHGCPWDLQQSFTSIAPHTLEEVYEVIDAIESGDMSQLQGELGDLLFQIVFYAQLGREQGLSLLHCADRQEKPSQRPERRQQKVDQFSLPAGFRLLEDFGQPRARQCGGGGRGGGRRPDCGPGIRTARR